MTLLHEALRLPRQPVNEQSRPTRMPLPGLRGRPASEAETPCGLRPSGLVSRTIHTDTRSDAVDKDK